jgi:hypothetical protein
VHELSQTAPTISHRWWCMSWVKYIIITGKHVKKGRTCMWTISDLCDIVNGLQSWQTDCGGNSATYGSDAWSPEFGKGFEHPLGHSSRVTQIQQWDMGTRPSIVLFFRVTRLQQWGMEHLMRMIMSRYWFKCYQINRIDQEDNKVTYHETCSLAQSKGWGGLSRPVSLLALPNKV